MALGLRGAGYLAVHLAHGSSEQNIQIPTRTMRETLPALMETLNYELLSQKHKLGPSEYIPHNA